MRAKELLWAMGAEVRERRTALGLSQEELSDRAGMSRNMLSAIELGQYNPSFLKLFALFTALDLTPSSVLTRAERRLRKQ